MSMKMLTILQFVGTLAAYSMVTLLFPALLLKKRFQHFRLLERILGYFLIGNCYIIYFVFLLQFLHISNRVTLILATLLPFLILFLKKTKGRKVEILEYILSFIEDVLAKKIGIKTYLSKKLRKLKSPRAKEKYKKMARYMPDVVLIGVIVMAVFYVYGNAVFQILGYKASDILVHSEWINNMKDNKIFASGVYPHGFHCVIYYLSTVFDIESYVLFRVFSMVQVIFIHLILVLCLRGICKTIVAPYLGVLFYILLNVFPFQTYFRYTNTLPQEFGMLFLFPTMYFLIRFLDEKMKADALKTKEEKLMFMKNVRDYLIAFCMSFSLTFTAHFYDTMIAGVMCIGVAIGYAHYFFKWRNFKQVLFAGVIGILASLLPMLVGLLFGNKLQGSLFWGLNVMNGTQDETGKMITKTTHRLPNIKAALKTVYHQMVEYVGNESYQITNLVLLTIVILFLFGIIYFLIKKRRRYANHILALCMYMGIMCIVLALKPLGLPQLMDVERSSVFFIYSLAAVWALDVDGFSYLLFGWEKKKRLIQVMPFLAFISGTWAIWRWSYMKDPLTIDTFETNGAITCLTNIMKEEPKNTWTICSANDEMQMVYGRGYHYETISFLRDMEKIDENPELKIPTETVYFFIEKLPVAYSDIVNEDEVERKRVSEDGAKQPISDEDGLLPYVGTQRWITMSHMYYWAEQFKKLYPNEMEVYYEDDEFICYRIAQNPESLYNLAIDYGYNQP